MILVQQQLIHCPWTTPGAPLAFVINTVVISEHTSAESEMQNGTDIAQIPESGSTSGGTGNSSKSYPLGSSRGPPRFRCHEEPDNGRQQCEWNRLFFSSSRGWKCYRILWLSSFVATVT
ncbi:unnamed protein product [Nezara viridula]|uniref:Uncharacterized protein n=1 Tax=Nezara viridula TaxID=85310 RepID=A0A9P0HUY2_NEZVI|nr:unnamed protein product [Nezara viridula]